MGRIADFDTRLLTLAVIQGALQGRTEEQVNLVNAPSMAEERGIVVEEKSVTEAQDFNELIRVTVIAGGERVAVAGTGIGPHRVPHLVEVQGRRLTVELEPFVTVFRYADLPGMIGRVGTIFGRHGINISSAAVGHAPDGSPPTPSRRRGSAPRGDGRDDRRGRAREVVRGDRRLGGVRTAAGLSCCPDSAGGRWPARARPRRLRRDVRIVGDGYAGRRDIEARRAGRVAGARAPRPATRQGRGTDRGRPRQASTSRT